MIVEETDPGLEYAGHDAGGGAIYRYNGLPFTGVMICRYSDGTIFQEISHVNGYENGCMREYDSNGNLISEFYSKLNIQYGIMTEWDENGNVIATYDLGPEP